jgi:phosphate transport system protein
MTVHFQREIEKLKSKLLHLCALVEDGLRRAVESLESRDTEMAAAVVARDNEIDRLEVDLEEDCLKILALHQPVAIDLRFVITALKINNDLERVGDLAVNIAERTIDLATAPLAESPVDLTDMVQVTVSMLQKSIDALVNLDARLAAEVARSDDRIDDMHRQTFAQITEAIRARPEHTAALLSLLSVSRHLERIADHATNIAEDVIYMVEGRIARHAGNDGATPR